MPVLTLTKTDTTKTGKTRAYFNGATHWKEAYYLGKDIVLPPIGTVMDCTTVSKRFDGSEFETWFLQGWAAVNGQTPATPAAAPSAPAAYNAPAAPAGDGLAVGPADALRFISNMVGSAITSGAIKGPNDMSAWAAQAFRVVRSIQSGGLLADARTAKQTEKAKQVAPPVEDAMPEPPPREEGDPGFSDDVPF